MPLPPCGNGTTVHGFHLDWWAEGRPNYDTTESHGTFSKELRFTG